MLCFCKSLTSCRQVRIPPNACGLSSHSSDVESYVSTVPPMLLKIIGWNSKRDIEQVSFPPDVVASPSIMTWVRSPTSALSRLLQGVPETQRVFLLERRMHYYQKESEPSLATRASYLSFAVNQPALSRNAPPPKRSLLFTHKRMPRVFGIAAVIITTVWVQQKLMIVCGCAK